MVIKFRLQKQPIKNKVLKRIIKERKEPGIPFNLGIKDFKRLVAQSPMSKSDKNKAAKLYKKRAYERFEAIKAEYERQFLLEGLDKEEEV